MKTYTDDLDPWFVTGFAEREASFTFSRSRRGLAVYFVVRQAGADLQLLRRIRQYFGGIGKIYTQRRAGPGASTAGVSFRVTRSHELLRVVNHFDLYPPQGSRAKCFEVWREMILLKSGPQAADADELNLLAAQLSSLAPRNRTRGRVTGHGTTGSTPR